VKGSSVRAKFGKGKMNRLTLATKVAVMTTINDENLDGPRREKRKKEIPMTAVHYKIFLRPIRVPAQ